MKLHQLVTEHPAYVDLQRRRRELEEARLAQQRRVQEATERFAKVKRQYVRDLSRAVGDEEVASLVEPQVPAILTSVRDVALVQEEERRSLVDEEHELLASLAGELVDAITDRERELRDGARVLVAPILPKLRELVGELNDVMRTEHELVNHAAEAASGERVGAGVVDYRRTAAPKSVTLEAALAAIVQEPVVEEPFVANFRDRGKFSRRWNREGAR